TAASDEGIVSRNDGGGPRQVAGLRDLARCGGGRKRRQEIHQASRIARANRDRAAGTQCQRLISRQHCGCGWQPLEDCESEKLGWKNSDDHPQPERAFRESVKPERRACRRNASLLSGGDRQFKSDLEAVSPTCYR